MDNSQTWQPGDPLYPDTALWSTPLFEFKIDYLDPPDEPDMWERISTSASWPRPKRGDRLT